MFLTVSTTHRPTSDFGYLLHKHPDKFQSYDLSFGKAHVFYPEMSDERATAALVLDVDPVGTVRGKSREQRYLLDQYVNDRPYVASSYLSVALSQVFGTALGGRCKDRPELVTQPLPLTAQIAVLPVRGGGAALVEKLFAPLGYTVETTRHPLDERFPEWGESNYYTVTLSATTTVSQLLTHLYVLVPVFDNDKHYFVGAEELEKLLDKGAGWLASHPEKELITRRYLGNRANLFRAAMARLVEEEEGEEDPAVAEEEGETAPAARVEERIEQTVSLNQQRHAQVLDALRASGARSVLDLGCGEGKLLQSLLAERQFQRIVGLDVSIRALEVAKRRLKFDRMSEAKAERIELLHGSLIYRDARLTGFDAAAVVEVIEHLDPPRLSALERVLFEFARPATVVVTTPNSEYNVKWESLPAGQFRHGDHRFEWTRAEFENWAASVAARHGYSTSFASIGPFDEVVGSPTQMCVFKCK